MLAYDPARYLDVETVEQAVNIIVCPTEEMTAQQRWDNETPELMKIIERHVKHSSTVLDYGCGIGRFAKPLIEKLQCKVVGVDISPNMRTLATSLIASPKFFAIDPPMFDSYLFYEGATAFDAAIAVWVLQHCIDLKEAINRIAVSMKLGGKLIILNNVTRCVPVENGEWADDGLDVDREIINAGFEQLENGSLDVSVAPGWMQQGTFWAVYQRVGLSNNLEARET